LFIPEHVRPGAKTPCPAYNPRIVKKPKFEYANLNVATWHGGFVVIGRNQQDEHMQ
jgi:hypothetical protein